MYNGEKCQECYYKQLKKVPYYNGQLYVVPNMNKGEKWFEILYLIVVTGAKYE